MKHDNENERSPREIEEELSVENDARRIASLSHELNEVVLEVERRKVALRLGRRANQPLKLLAEEDTESV